MSRRGDRRGVVLLVVLFFTLLLAASVTSFVRRATIDSMVARNREHAAQAAALARGGINIAQALLVEDRLTEGEISGGPIDTHLDLWAKAGEASFEAGAGRGIGLFIQHILGNQSVQSSRQGSLANTDVATKLFKATTTQKSIP